MIRWGDRAVEVDDGVVEFVEKISYPVVEDVFQIEEELTEIFWHCSRIIPPENVVDWTTIIMMSGTDHLGGDKVEEGVDGNMNDGNGEKGRTVAPLVDMVCGD